MKKFNRTHWRPLLFGAYALTLSALIATSARAASLIITNEPPVPGTYDVYNFAGADNDTLNVSGGADQQTYVAPDRPTQGQLFTTPASSGGFLVTDIWIRHCGYTNTAPGNGTWWNLASGAVYTIRVTDPSKLGQAGFALNSETYTATGTENAGVRWTGGGTVGDDSWLHFTLNTPIHLSGGTQYGIDLTATTAGGGNYFEWLGTSADNYAGGQSYTGTAGGTPGNSETMNGGDRVFFVQLSQTVPRVAPTLSSSSRFTPVGQTVPITVTIPQVVNASSSVTLTLTTDNAGIGAFSPAGAVTTNLSFAAGATNVQTINAFILGAGIANISVVTNDAFLDASIQIGSAISAHEAFDYDPAVQPYLSGAAGGSGFGGAWVDDAFASVIVPGLIYNVSWSGGTTSVAVSSNAVTVSSAGQAFRALPGTYGGVGGGTVWVSFLVQGGGLNNWGGVSLFTGTTGERLFMGEVTANSPNNTWGFLGGSATYMNFANSVTPGSQTDFLVYRIDFPSTNGGKARVTFYADPPLSATVPYTATGSGNVDNFTFDTVRLGTGGSVTWGELRIGTDWASVVPIVGPAMPAGNPTPELAAPANFLPIGQTSAVTVTIPTNSIRPLTLVITNSNPTAFSISSTNAEATSLTFGVGATNVQTLNVQVLAAGAATFTVVSNSAVNSASINVASQVSASDEFQYDAGTDMLPGQAGGSGFDVNTWTGGGSVITPGLNYAGLVTSSNAVTILSAAAGGSGNATRTFYLSSGNYGGVGGGTVWISFLVQGAFPDASASDNAGVWLVNNGSTAFFMGLDTEQPNNGKWGYTGPGAGWTGFGNSVAPSTNTDLLVYRIDFPSNAGDLATVTLYANPPAGMTPPATPTGIGSAYSFNFNGVQLGTTFSMNFDEVRVGGTWSEVVPLSATPKQTLTIVKLAGSQVQISWPAVGGYTLMSSTSLTGPWSSAGLSVSTVNGTNSATDTITGSARFYRLQ
ncbi:MAG TPA: hypothetical protein VK327_13025 [Candidatus Paceibacterota bacterium]|nr:hypothetical protein [Candidatus Paceibacterota bacterium]